MPCDSGIGVIQYIEHHLSLELAADGVQKVQGEQWSVWLRTLSVTKESWKANM